MTALSPMVTPGSTVTFAPIQTFSPMWTGNEYFYGLDSFFEYIDSERRKIQFRVMKARYTGKTRCPECGGSRLRKEALYVRVSDCTLAELEPKHDDALLVFIKE